MSKLYVDSVMKNYADKRLLSDVFLSCSKGEIIGLFGRNGAGKSTLLEIIFGSIKADNKFVRVEDKLVNTVYDSRNLISYLPQHNFLPDHAKIKSLIKLFCSKQGAVLISKNHIIKSISNKKASQLSGGELRILEVLIIIYADSQFVLLDEPFNGIAPILKVEIMAIIKEESKTKGFIITDHDYQSVLEILAKIYFSKMELLKK